MLTGAPARRERKSGQGEEGGLAFFQLPMPIVHTLERTHGDAVEIPRPFWGNSGNGEK